MTEDSEGVRLGDFLAEAQARARAQVTKEEDSSTEQAVNGGGCTCRPCTQKRERAVKEDARITTARAYYLEQAKMQQAMPSVTGAFEGAPLPTAHEEKLDWARAAYEKCSLPVPTEHEARTRNFGLRYKLQDEGAEPNFAEALAKCHTLEAAHSLALKEIEYLEGVIRTHENINRILVNRETNLIMSYRSLSRAHLRLVSSFWERFKFLFLRRTRT